MKLEDLKEKITEILQEMPDWEIVGIWNDYCDDVKYFDDKIYSMDLFDELCEGLTPSQIVGGLAADFRSYDSWFKDGIYGYDSVDDVWIHIDIEDLVDWIIDNGISDNSEIKDLLDEYAEGDE